MCYKCKTPLRCGDECCRSKSEGPFYHLEPVSHTECLSVCEVCGFKIDAMVDESLDYYSCILDRSWFSHSTDYSEEHMRSMAECALKDYTDLYAKYVTNATM